MSTTSIDVTKLDGQNGVKLINSAGPVGAVVANIGDINNDGLDDVALGDSAGAGLVQVVFGVEGGTDSTIDLANLDGSNGFVINGEEAGIAAGFSIAAAGDFNNDGVDDFIFGAPGASPNGEDQAGQAFLIFGREDGDFDPTFDLITDFNTDTGFIFNGVQGARPDSGIADLAGIAVSGIGDVNNDGIDDIIIGAFQSLDFEGTDIDINSPGGRAYVVFGTEDLIPGPEVQFSLADLDGTNGFELEGTVLGGSAGAFVSGAGDVNGDGIDDFLIGAPQNSGGFESGGNVSIPTYTYVVMGSDDPFPALIPLSVPGDSAPNNAVFTGEQVSAEMGIAVTNVGDVNGDGIDDVAASAWIVRNGSSNFPTSVVFGVDGGLPNVTDLPKLDGTDGFNFKGGGSGFVTANLGPAGDFNDDGIDDFIVGSPDGQGQVYIIFGTTEGFPSVLEPDALDGTNGLILKNGDGEGAALGIKTDGGGDFNGDGLPDVLFHQGARDGSAPTVYVVYGNKDLGADAGLLFEGKSLAEKFVGKEGDDEAFGFRGNDALFGKAGDDSLFGGQGHDLLKGGRGDDAIGGGRGKDAIFGGVGDDLVRGGLDKDLVVGGLGNDRLNGGKDSDIVKGGIGDDTVLGGAGDDLLSGGLGSDLFRFNGDFGNDVIVDFNENEDRLFFRGGAKVTETEDAFGKLLIVEGETTSGTIRLLEGFSSLAESATDDLLALI